LSHKAIKPHQPEFSDILQANTGEVLKFERRPTEYPGWIWCTNAQAVQAWVPTNWVSIEGDECRMNRDYVSKELRLAVGEIVNVLEIESGWAWVSKDENEVGWVPMAYLQSLDSEDTPI
jgi:hypothetical protein